MWLDYRGIMPEILTHFGYHGQLPKIIAEAHRQEQAQLRKQGGIEKIVEVEVPVGNSGFGVCIGTRHVGSQAQTRKLSLKHPGISTLYLDVPLNAFSNEEMRRFYANVTDQIVEIIRLTRETMPTLQAAGALQNPR